MAAPVFYALTRYAWALGFPLGMGEEQFRSGQASGMWIGGALSLGSFCLVGAFLMLGLVQRTPRNDKKDLSKKEAVEMSQTTQTTPVPPYVN